MSDVKYSLTRGEMANIQDEPLKNGQILFDRETPRILMDTMIDETLTRIPIKEGIFNGTQSEWMKLTQEQQAVYKYVNFIDDAIPYKLSFVYGFHIDGSESDPDAAVTYLEDAVSMIPAHMDYLADEFSYGSWEDAFFMPRPCMLKYDGTVDYYLDPNDYAKKVDGTASDISNTSYEGNAMMEWGKNGTKIWMKIVPNKNDSTSASVYISNIRADNDFHDWSFHNCNGQSVDHFYTPIYNGSYDDNMKLRSLSGQTVGKSKTGTEEMTAAKANNPGTDELWNIECFADRLLINMLLVLMGKTLDTQTAFGYGLAVGGNERINDGFTTGVHNAKGLFYGTEENQEGYIYTNAVKIFGMENYYGFQARRTNGLILADGIFKVKLTYGQEDGSVGTGYNTNGLDYKVVNSIALSGNGGFISENKYTEDGMFPQVMNGTSSTYCCDTCRYVETGYRFALFGGSSSNYWTSVGAFCLDLSSSVLNTHWDIGASLSCKPLAV